LTTTTLLLGGWMAMAAVMALLWNVQRVRRNAGIVDVAWSLGTAVLGRDAGLPVQDHGHPGHKGTGARQSRRCVSCVPADDERVARGHGPGASRLSP